jgi:hypothetical protein
MKSTTGFEAKPGETVATNFETKLEKTVAARFETKPLETVATSFEAKPVKTVRLVLRPNHSETVDLSFEAQPRNPRSSSPHARCRPHTAPPNLSTARSLSPNMCDHPRSSALVFYSCHGPHRCTSCHTCHRHTTRQANMILQTKQR